MSTPHIICVVVPVAIPIPSYEGQDHPHGDDFLTSLAVAIPIPSYEGQDFLVMGNSIWRDRRRNTYSFL